ncbi:hypothetical protein M2101_000060 [Parabacteroides sp. PM5-20]|nr:hypothetical protein [Parabacteroides sp. PM5-20]
MRENLVCKVVICNYFRFGLLPIYSITFFVSNVLESHFLYSFSFLYLYTPEEKKGFPTDYTTID